MELKSNIIIYVVGGLLSMGALSSITNNIRDTFFPPEKTYSKEAVELFYTMMSIQNWEQLTIECGWSTSKYISRMKRLLKSSLIDR